MTQASGEQQVVHTALPHKHSPDDGGLGVQDAIATHLGPIATLDTLVGPSFLHSTNLSS